MPTKTLPLKVVSIVFGIMHIATMYLALFISFASDMARFDGQSPAVSAFTESLLMNLVNLLLFPFGYLRIPLIGPWMNSAFWAYVLYRVLIYFFRRKAV